MDRTIETALSKRDAGVAPNLPLFAACALLFIASAVGTILWCRSMAGGMLMPGGWTMSMAWMRMPGQTWTGAAASFMGMWVLMMVAMMLPSLAPALAGFRRAWLGPDGGRLGTLTTFVGAGYFLAWTPVGAFLYPLGVWVVAAEMRWPILARSAPCAAGIVVLLAGCFQLTAWKARHLGCCRATVGCGRADLPSLQAAISDGLQLGVHCVSCCCGFMLVLVATGVMNLCAMCIIAAAITMERVAPWPVHTARAAGVVMIAYGAVSIAHALHTV